MAIQLKQVSLTFKRDHTHRMNTRRLVVHHSASAAANTTIYDIQAWHLAKGWYGIGYHYIIYPNGDIYQGRPEWAIGAHAYQDARHNANGDGIGICLIGDFTKEHPTDAQLQALVNLVKYLRGIYGVVPVIGHKDVMPTQCPGPNFPWNKFNEMIMKREVPVVDWKLKIMKDAEKEGLIMPNAGHAADEPATKWFVLAVAINVLKRLGVIK